MNDEEIANIFIFSNDGIGMRNIMIGGNENLISGLLALWESFYEELKA